MIFKLQTKSSREVLLDDFVYYKCGYRCGKYEYPHLLLGHLNMRDEDGFTLLHYLVFYSDNIKHFKHIVKHGGDPFAEDKKYGVTPYDLAKYNNRPKIVEYIEKRIKK